MAEAEAAARRRQVKAIKAGLYLETLINAGDITRFFE
jgi:hypothetical protein